MFNLSGRSTDQIDMEEVGTAAERRGEGIGTRFVSSMNRPLSGSWCALGWCVGTVLFVGIVALLGGPATLDSRESVASTLAVAHGHLSCAYPANVVRSEPLIAPLYVLYSGALAAVAHVGAGTFPSSALGAHCGTADAAIYRWAAHSDALAHTLYIGYTAWLVLLVGVVSWLRAARRGRCGWEPLAVVATACLPPVFMCVVGYFHPQDLVALGLALAAMATALRRRWVLAGVLMAAAVLTQQYTLMIAAPLLVLAPVGRRVRYAGAAAVTAAVIVLPLVTLTSGRALRPIAFGSGDNPSIGGTLMWELTRSGASMVLLSRLLPLVLSLALAAWVVRRLGASEARSNPAVMVAVVAVSLSLRLIFEQNLFVYYFMALAVTLLLLDITLGHIRASFVAWLTTLSLVFFLEWGTLVFHGSWAGPVKGIVPFAVMVTVVPIVVSASGRGISRWNLALCGAVFICALTVWPIRGNPVFVSLPTWLWQILFVGTGVALAVGPLLSFVSMGATSSVEGPRGDEETAEPAPSLALRARV